VRRVETKNQWARDDPAFVVVLACMMAVASLAYAIAFRVSSFWQYCRIVFSAIFFDFLLIGVVVATVAWCAAPHPLACPRAVALTRRCCRWFANNRLRVPPTVHNVEQRVEWL